MKSLVFTGLYTGSFLFVFASVLLMDRELWRDAFQTGEPPVLTPQQLFVEEVIERRVPSITESQARALAHHLVSLCQENQVDPLFVLSLIKIESGFNPRAVSKKGALGLMQLMPATGRIMAAEERVELSESNGLVDPFVNLTLGVAYFSKLLKKYQGDLWLALAAYNLGPARLEELRAEGSEPRAKNFVDAFSLELDRLRSWQQRLVQN